MHNMKDKLVAAGFVTELEAELSDLNLKQLVKRRNKTIALAVHSDTTEQTELLAINAAIRLLQE